jgi:hypothetical protein
MTDALKAAIVDGRLGYDMCPVCDKYAGEEHAGDCAAMLKANVLRLRSELEAAKADSLGYKLAFEDMGERKVKAESELADLRLVAGELVKAAGRVQFCCFENGIHDPINCESHDALREVLSSPAVIALTKTQQEKPL